MRKMRALVIASALVLGGDPSEAQTIGTFSWKLDPFCDVVTFTVTADGPAFRLSGFDQPCGGAKVPAAGIVVPNPDGTFTLAFYLVTAQGLSSHTTATLSPPTYSGPWRDASGQTGTLTFGAGSGSGAPRPVAALQQRVAGACTGSEFVQKVREDGSVECGAAPAGNSGDITGVGAGTGLSGGGASGEVTLALAPGGVGSTEIANGAVGSSKIDVTQVQRRIVTTCAAGLFLSRVFETGTALCSDGGGATTTALGTGTLAVNTGLANTAVGTDALGANTTANSGTAVGYEALRSNTTGFFNAALGYRALWANTTGRGNTALGAGALTSNITGGSNVGVGEGALNENTAGAEGTAVGSFSLRSNTTGLGNVAVGYGALDDNTIGAHNIAVGRYAGENLTTGDNNIAIGHSGVAGEADTIRIGGSQSRAFISGIVNRTTGVANAIPVLIDSAGQLGTASSSRRIKEDIRDMGDASGALFRLRPVTFRYIQPYDDGSKPLDYGLIAEEVAEVYPDLVVRNRAGEVETVQYQKLTPMLLNELQRLRRQLDAVLIRLADLEGSRR